MSVDWFVLVVPRVAKIFPTSPTEKMRLSYVSALKRSKIQER